MALGGAGVLALLVRLAYLRELHGSLLLSGLMGDARVYDAWARDIAAGNWIGTEVFYQAPFYPYFLAIVYAIGAPDPGLVRVIQSVLGAASCVLLGLAGRRFFSDRIGVIAAILLAVYPPALFFDGLIQKASLDVFLVTLTLALAGEFQARRRWPWIASAGVVAGALVLNRENARVLVPVIAAWLWLGFPDAAARRRAWWIGAFLAATLIVLVPVGLRNSRVGGEFLISTSQLGPNFYIGNHPQASGTYESLVPERGDAIFEREDATRIASAAAGRGLSAREVTDYWFRRGLEWVRHDPAAWLALLGKKMLLTVNAAELPDTESMAAYAGESRILRSLGWLGFGVILPLAALGTWALRREWRRWSLPCAIAASLAASVAVFYVVARYRHSLVPAVLLFAAAGVAALGEMRERGGRRILPGLTLAVAAAVIAYLPILTVRDQTYLNLGSLLAMQGRSADAIPALERAVSQDPGHAEAQFRLGLAYRDAGRRADAVGALSEAVRLRPEHGDALAALGVLLAEEGRAGEALPYFQKAAELAPGDPRAQLHVAMALASSGRVEASLPHFQEAVRLQPADADTRLAFGQALFAAGRFDESIAQYEAAARSAADPLDALTLTAQAHAAAGRRAEAVVSLQKALALATSSGRADAAARIAETIRQLK